MSTDLRSANKKLLDRLKQSQKEISERIIAVKHSDLRVLDKVPLTSTIAYQRNKNVTYEASDSNFKRKPKLHKMSSSGILKKKSPTSKRLPSPTSIRNTQLSKPKSADKIQPVSRFLQSKMKDGTGYLSFGDSLLISPGNCRPMHTSQVERSSPVHLCSKEENEPVSVTFKTPDADHNDGLPNAEKRKTPPLLGYDWIAGVVENSEPSPNYSDSFIEEMKEFRKVNRSECHSTRYWNEMVKTPKTPITALSSCKHYKMREKTPDPSDTRDPRIINFTINKRLFPVPVDPNETVPPGSENSPRYIRVSIPKSSLLSPYRYKAMHQSTYTDGFDSLSLPDHCVMGWQHTVPKRIDRQQSQNTGLDLRSSLRPRENLVNLQLKSGQASIPVKNEGKELSFLQESSLFPHQHR